MKAALLIVFALASSYSLFAQANPKHDFPRLNLGSNKNSFGSLMYKVRNDSTKAIDSSKNYKLIPIPPATSEDYKQVKPIPPSVPGDHKVELIPLDRPDNKKE